MRYRKGTGRTPLDGEPTKDSSIARRDGFIWMGLGIFTQAFKDVFKPEFVNESPLLDSLDALDFVLGDGLFYLEAGGFEVGFSDVCRAISRGVGGNWLNPMTERKGVIKR